MTGYMKFLRDKVGHSPVLQCGASMIIYKNGKILLQKRKDNGCWSYAGGSVELGEKVEDAAAREMLEETGLKANSLKLFGVFSGMEYYYKYPNGDEVYNIDTVFVCDDFSGDIIRQTDETDDLKWFALRDIPDNISPPTKTPLIEFVKQTLNNLTE